MNQELFYFAYFGYMSFLFSSALVGIYYENKRQTRPLINGIIWGLSLVLMISGFIGARLFHVFWEEPKYYLNNPLEIYKFWNGGFVFFGGLVSSVLAGLYFVKSKGLAKKGILECFDFYLPFLILGYGLGRIGCFWVGCCQGSFFIFGTTLSINLATTIFELSLLLLLIENRRRFHWITISGQEFFIWLLLHSVFRFVSEFYRIDFRGPIFVISISSWLALVFIGISTIFLFKNRN